MATFPYLLLCKGRKERDFKRIRNPSIRVIWRLGVDTTKRSIKGIWFIGLEGETKGLDKRFRVVGLVGYIGLDFSIGKYWGIMEGVFSIVSIIEC